MGTNKLSGKPDEMLGVTCNGLASHPGGVAILLVTCHCTSTLLDVERQKHREGKGNLDLFFLRLNNYH